MKENAKKCDSVEIGDVYNELTVIAEDFEKEEEYWETHPKYKHQKFFKCKCSCGNEKTVNVYQLVNGRCKSCGHLHRDGSLGKTLKDLQGMRFNYLTVVSLDESKPRGSGKHAYWICKCEKCGNTKSIRSSDLIDGSAIDCGCGTYKRVANSMAKDLKGKDFGHLHVIDRDWDSCKKGGGVHARWLCKCDLCGRIESVSSDILTEYGKDRCKRCSYISMGEQKIIELLEDNNISFVHDKSYLDLRYPDTGGAPRFDFRITQNSDCDYIIEFDGEQHFRQIPRYDDRIAFESRVKRDNFKNEWCATNNIPLIRIPYTRLNKLEINDLKPETTKYLHTQ